MFISLDLETTGINPDKDKIIEFGAVKFDLKGNTETLQTLIHPGITLPEIITHITGITDEDLKNAPPFQEKAEEISAFIGDLPIIGHNIQFDTSFLRNHHIELKNPEYDTVQLASILFPGLNSYSLEILTHLLDLKHKDKHRALDDAVAAMELFLKLKDKFQELDPDLIKKIHSLCEKTQWPTAKFLKTLPPTKSKTHILPPLTALPKSPLPENYKELLNTKKSQLFQISPPYYSLIQSLAKDAHKDTYISVPHMLFHDLTPTLPDSITKIDSPKKYISQRRLSEFENKKFFEDYEFTGLIKTLVWLKQTKTGLLPEIIFFNQEKQIILHINADKDFTELKDEPFVQKAMEKDKTSPAICSHQYLIDQKPEIKDLILIDLDKFTKSIFYEQTIYLKLDILLNQLTALKEFSPENKSIESLMSKSTILFGLIGLIFEKYNDRSPFIPRATISPIEIQNQEWKDIKSSIKNLKEISLELGEILTPQTHGYLQNWKDSLRKLEKIFKDTNLETNMIWVEKDYMDNIVIQRAPFSLSPHLKEILNKTKNYKIISENLDLEDDASLIKNLNDLPPSLPLIKEPPKIENLTILIPEDIEDHETRKAILSDSILPFLKKHKGSLAMIFNSKKQLQYFTLKLAKPLKEAGVTLVSQLTGNLGKLTEKFLADPENSILFVTPNLWENFPFHEKISNLIIHKLPFDPPSDPYLMTTSTKFKNPFIELQVPQAAFGLRKSINRLRLSKGEKQVVILDTRLLTKDYSKPINAILETLGDVQVINTSSL